jgi:hypothetical protein
VTGLNAPKGLRAEKGMLWVSDIDEMVGIEIASGKIAHRVKIKGAKFLNDDAIGSNGEVYVSDMFGNAIYVIPAPYEKAKVLVKTKAWDAPNGLLLQGDELVVAGWGPGIKADFSTKGPGHLYRVNLKTKKMTLVTPEPLGHLDGLEAAADGGYLVSDWMAGKVFHVAKDGSAKLLLEGFKGSADIGFIPPNTLVVPRMAENRVTAYTLQ